MLEYKYYCDIFRIFGKGCFVTGQGKTSVFRDWMNGRAEMIANDCARIL